MIPDNPVQASEALKAQLREYLKSGPMTFEQFIEKVLYEPRWGYYQTPYPKLGPHGDFITAPELSPFFSYCLGEQCYEVLMHLSKGDILEFGAGNGTMAAHILNFLDKRNLLPEHYLILELSPYLKDLQYKTIEQHCPHLLSKVKWINQLPSFPFTGIILANEVLDAMPVHKFLVDENIQEYYVTYEKDQFQWILDSPSSPKLKNSILQIKNKYFPNIYPYQSEINLKLEGWINAIHHFLKSGIIIICDYGFSEKEYYHPSRYMGTLMCHYRHTAHGNPLINIGLQDITSHVNFTALAEYSRQAGLEVNGYTTQANFLINLGLLDKANEITDPKDYYQQSQAIKQLILPSEMGELFKCMAITKNIEISLKGFQGKDFRWGL